MAHKDDRNRGKRNWTEDETQRDFGSRGDFERDQSDYGEDSMRSRGRNDLENYDDSGRGGSQHAGRRPSSPLSHRAQLPADDWRPGGMKSPRFGEATLPGGDYSTGENYPRGREYRNPDYRGEARFGETYRDEARESYNEDRGSAFSNYPNQDYGVNTLHWDSARSDRDIRASRARMDDRDWNSPAYRDEGFFGSGAETNRNWTGPHAGKGPQNYRRSDERIHEDICERLTMHGQIDATNIEVKVNDGEVTLSGSVDSRHAKRLAEDAIEDVPGLRDINNQLRVAQRQDTDREQHVSTHSETDRGSSSKRTTK